MSRNDLIQDLKLVFIPERCWCQKLICSFLGQVTVCWRMTSERLSDYGKMLPTQVFGAGNAMVM
ncbi:conserved hypothetical protein [delta proteobacterium NaphS2]|nr:conserved hypothetical protein [delta proteobacterium NaphS2]